MNAGTVMMRILLIDDDETDQYIARQLIKRTQLPYELVIANDGVEALDMLAGSDIKPDIILLDINMPRMDGHEFLAEYVKTGPGDIPIIAMLTSSDQRDDRDRTLEYKPVKDYLLKPLSKEKLVSLEAIVKEIDPDIAGESKADQ